MTTYQQNMLPSAPITKIHGRYYDLSTFKHPGGDVAIESAFGRDATELFESHHLFSNREAMSAMLDKYRIPDPSPENAIASNDVYDWDATLKSEFTQQLHSRVRAVLGSAKDIKANTCRAFEYVMLFAVHAVCYYYFIRGEWWASIAHGIMLWVYGVNIFHDASHFACSYAYPRLNQWLLWSGPVFATPYVWLHQHIIAHHSFPNVPGRDPDLYHTPVITRHSHDIRLRPVYKHQPIAGFVRFPLAIVFGLGLRNGLQATHAQKINRVVELSNTTHINPASTLPRLLLMVCVIAGIPLASLGFSFKALAFMVIPYGIFSTCFMVSSQVNHLVPDADEHAVDPNFFIHQIKTGHNVAPMSYLTGLLMGGLNLQIEHHLFPSVNHTHLRKIAPIVKQLCGEYGIPYNESPSLWIALKKHAAHLLKFSRDKTT